MKIISIIVLVFGIFYFFVETAFFAPKNNENSELANTHIQPPLLETQTVIKKPTALEQSVKEKSPQPLKKPNNTVNVMQEYYPDIKNGTEETNSDMPALYPDKFGNETYDPNEDDIEISIGEFIPVPLESLGVEIANLSAEESPQDPDDLLVEMGEMFTFEEKSIGEPISAEKTSDESEVLMGNIEEVKEIGDDRPATTPDLD